MELIIYDIKGILPKTFIRWFQRRVKQELIRQLQPQKANFWNDYLNEQYDDFKIYPLKLSSDKLLRLGIDNIIFSYFQNQITFRIDNNILVPGLDRIKLVDICKLINYGNLSHEGYPLFSSVFTEMQSNFEQYVREYFL